MDYHAYKAKQPYKYQYQYTDFTYTSVTKFYFKQMLKHKVKKCPLLFHVLSEYFRHPPLFPHHLYH